MVQSSDVATLSSSLVLSSTYGFAMEDAMSERQRIDLLRSRDPNMVVNLQLLWIVDCLWIVFVNCEV
jgi:hypothetical protein